MDPGLNLTVPNPFLSATMLEHTASVHSLDIFKRFLQLIHKAFLLPMLLPMGAALFL